MTRFKRQAITLKAYRQYKELTQGELAKYLGYTSPQIISNIERGIQGLPTKKLKYFKKDTFWHARIVAAIIYDVHAKVLR